MLQDSEQLRRIIEGALLAAGRPLDLRQLQQLFDPLQQPDADRLRAALDAIAAGSAGHAWELRHTASGYRLQVRAEFAPWIGRLWEEKPRRYSRALLETLALIAYRQPVTRGDIEAVRGVAVSSDTIRTLLEREWIRVVGHRDVPGRPALYATTRQFLDYFNLSSLDQLPPLGELRELDFPEGLELAPGEAKQTAEPEEVAAAPSTAP
jgi:segregation and condensation protein B